MKVAIMGAGLSGLACAITLEKNGINPVIFEKRSRVGDRFVNGEALLPLLDRPARDSMAYLADAYGIFLQPVANIKSIIFHSEHNSAAVSGHLGFTNLRGRDEDSFESQLARQVKSQITFNSPYTYEELLADYTHVIMATGDAEYAAKVQDYKIDLTTTLKGATVEGDFDRYQVIIWLNNDYAPKGYAYLLPISEKEANITIAYPDYPENKSLDIDGLWQSFYQRVRRDLKQDLKITDSFEIRGYVIGQCRYPRIGNTFFTGNCFGSIMPSFGFGQFPAIMTGIFAAQAICGIGDYEALTTNLRESYRDSLVLRRSMEKLNNHQLDYLVRAINTRWGEQVLTTQKYDPLKLIAHLLRPLIKAGGREQ